MPSSALIRYNFRVLMHHNWWLLVIPLAVSQLTIFWTATTQRFSPSLPASLVEFVSPLLAAFLCAHLLSAEYRSGIGAVLASKPVDISKVVLMRLCIAIGLVWGLGWLSLLAFYFGMEPYPMLPPGLAMMVSSLFLALLALTFATLFRHPLTGFGVAALYWLLDLPGGPPMNPYLSLKSLTSSFPVPGLPPDQPLTDSWWIAKILLLAAAIALYLLHRKWLFTLGSPLTLRKRRRTLAWAGTILAFYIVTGAAVKVTFGYANRGTLFPNDVGWFRRQFGGYAPLPVAALFGPNFQRYIGNIPSAWRVQQEGEADTMGDTIQHRRDLEHILEAAPNSLWAASAADLLGRLNFRGRGPVEERVKDARVVVDRYGTSPYGAYALQSIGRAYADASEKEVVYDPKARAVYEELLQRFPNSIYRSDAFRFLAESDRRSHNLAEAERHARQWVETGPVYERFQAQILLAEILRDEGKKDEAKQAAQQTFKAIQDFRRALQAGEVPLTEQQRVRLEKEAGQIQGRLGGFSTTK